VKAPISGSAAAASAPIVLRLVSLEAEQLSGTQYRNAAEVHLKWSISRSAGKRTYSYVATSTRLVPQA
jgi:hypothetical protein